MSISGVGSQPRSSCSRWSTRVDSSTICNASSAPRQEGRHLCRPGSRPRACSGATRACCIARRGFDNAITNVGVRINLAQVALGRISDITHQVKAATLQPGAIDSNGSTNAQLNAYLELGELPRPSTPRPAIAICFPGAAPTSRQWTLDHVMNGDGARAGFKQITAERKQADLGANGSAAC